jgi:hypothetical protein
MKRIASAMFAALLLYGCSSTPPVSELRAGAKSATFVQHGTEPLTYSFGVVDTASFWAQNGGSVGASLGVVGLVAGESAASAGRAASERKAPTATQIMKALYGNHPLVNETSRKVMPELARLWGVPYAPDQMRVVQAGTAFEDAQGNLVGVKATTDLVLTFAVTALTLTEKFSVGGAFAAGFTMGTNTKNVAGQTNALMRAYKRDPATGQYAKIWTQPCGGLAMYSKVAYPFPDVVQSREKAKELWDAAMPITIENCSKVVESLVKS